MADYNILEYGAATDGVSLSTEAIQRAIDLCAPGGRVVIPAGRFVSGALFLKSHMTLYLKEGARLVGSGNVEDFPVMGYPFEGYDQLCYASLINTDGAPHENICIDGKGIIDANGEALYERELEQNAGKRGRAVCIRNTEHVSIRNVEIRQSPAWCLHLLYCRDVLIEQVEIHTKYDENGRKYKLHNGDGIDVDSCRDVKILNSVIASQDDCIAVKSGRDVWGRRTGIPSENILIENCSFQSGFGVAMGSEMSGGVANVCVRNCTFENTFSIASIKAVRGRGGYIRNIRYENCSMKNRDKEIRVTKWFRGALYVDGFYGQSEFDADAAVETDEGTPVVEDLFFQDISIDTIEGHAVYLCGLPESPIKNITLEHVKAHGKFGMEQKNIDGLKLVDVDVTSENP